MLHPLNYKQILFILALTSAQEILKDECNPVSNRKSFKRRLNIGGINKTKSLSVF
ncbi:hypothetical protein Cabys_2058 [Caldithrix abyssi DSM 13497]|uniref:Uncharacterized protein n=1 Tax=Caldithrix abyssi DSM 13497 TaxID=880073 RepID=A0A1J1C832_CALAY|nr:hypothetical protein Cabys_2058 [Caldithrix abyssi DSM 13497]